MKTLSKEQLTFLLSLHEEDAVRDPLQISGFQLAMTAENDQDDWRNITYQVSEALKQAKWYLGSKTFRHAMTQCKNRAKLCANTEAGYIEIEEFPEIYYGAIMYYLCLSPEGFYLVCNPCYNFDDFNNECVISIPFTSMLDDERTITALIYHNFRQHFNGCRNHWATHNDLVFGGEEE